MSIELSPRVHDAIPEVVNKALEILASFGA